MRTPVPLLLALVMTVPVLAGCFGGPEELSEVVVPLEVEQIHVPDGAELIEDPVGAVLRWTNVTFPFDEKIVIPAGATLVRLEAELAADESLRTYMKNNETGRRRCNPDYVDTAWNVPHIGRHACSGLTAIDRPGTEWVIQVTGPVDEVTGLSPANTVRVVYDERPVDGVAAELALDRLSMPDHTLLPTLGVNVPSFDGTDLWVEVTLPQGDGPWPTIIAASPYNGQYDRLPHGGDPAMWTYWTQDWAQRGYAAVNVDVRGFGLSGGCVEVWGTNEQRDQAFIVDWVAEQDWSDGNVGFYGQSYVGTTPVAAAVQDPDALKAIIAVAPVINAYDDWHYGGVPNGENHGSPLYYQQETDPVPDPDPEHPEPFLDPLTLLTNKAKGVCDVTLAARANDPRAVYDEFYAERDFSLRAGNIDAAVLYTEGFEDRNVKSAMIPGWFNDITAPKLGIFGHWVHQHPTRADEEVLFLGWMDQYVKGKDIGFDALPEVLVASNVDTERLTDAWPTPGLETRRLWPDWDAGTLSEDATKAGGALLTIAPSETEPTRLRVEHTVTEPFALTGTAHLQVRGTLETKGNAFLGARLYDVHGDEADLVTYGMFNLAHDATHATWSPVTGASDVLLPFLPTEYVFQANHTLRIELYGVVDEDAIPGGGMPIGRFMVGDHPAGVGALLFDTVPLDAYRPLPMSAQP